MDTRALNLDFNNKLFNYRQPINSRGKRREWINELFSSETRKVGKKSLEIKLGQKMVDFAERNTRSISMEEFCVETDV